MAIPASSPPSFSPRRKWSIAFNVILATIAVVLTLAGINYLSNQLGLFKRFYLSTRTRVQLSPKTVNLLHSLTNDVQVIIYYDKDDPLYDDIVGLLREYQAQTRKLSVKTVDYYDPGAAQEIKLKYDLGSATNRDFIIFDSAGRKAFVDGNRLSDYKYDFERSADQDDPKLYVNKKRTEFNGEMLFSASIFAVSQAKPLKAYFLIGHGERSPIDTSDTDGYSKLAGVFKRNDVLTDTLNPLLGTNTIPLDCNLLVIAGPREELHTNELDKISQYLDQGGRLFVLFDVHSVNRQTGLENILAKWNVRVGHTVVSDPNYAVGDGKEYWITALAIHDVTKSILGSGLEMFLPRPVGRIKAPSSTALDEPQVMELAFSSTNSVLAGDSTGQQRPYPLITAVEKGGAKGVATERGTTRMLITGDAFFLENDFIDGAKNEDFADAAVNWLLDRTALLAGVGPQPVTEYRLLLAKKQVGEVRGILLGAIPGGILLFGGLVWLRRRK